jgi:prolyl 4-hydroxylase
MINTFYILLLTASLQLQSFLASDEHDQKNNPPISYGADISWPHHHRQVSSNYAWLPHNIDPKHYPVPSKYQDVPIQPLGDRQAFYETFLESCEKYYKEKKDQGKCASTEENRMHINLRQPSSMKNYTDIGFKKIRTPERVWKLLETFWEMNKSEMYSTQEVWGKGNTFTNDWESPTYMLSVENTKFQGGGENIKAEIWNAAREVISEWTNQELIKRALYGIRIYTNGSIIAPHVDRLPFVSSAILNVAQDVDEPWPLEVIGHDGKAYNVTMEPGMFYFYLMDIL